MFEKKRKYSTHVLKRQKIGTKWDASVGITNPSPVRVRPHALNKEKLQSTHQALS
jgi:hypothetical protein